ncbi:MAG: ATP-dependent sacrificial sulfur transferase LarE, partial [Nitrospirae bacterium]|nr:ATP-dependent sacrificial sulfur transferase LarE [Nitrospirota bacterium]
PDFVNNQRDRCFHCKDELFRRLLHISRTAGYGFVIDGSNIDDTLDWRPGRQAALRHGVRSPLIEAGFSKKEIRELSKSMGLPTWSKPASPCLSSRFPYGIKITKEALKKIELSESFLKELGFADIRVRYHVDVARIEVGIGDMERALKLRETIVERLKGFGFKYIALDMEGFRSGSLNE